MPISDHPLSPTRAAFALPFAAVLALAACKAPPPPAPPPPPTPIVVAPVVHCEPPRDSQDMAARHLLATQDRLGTLSPSDLTVEANRAIDPGSVEAAMDQALALGMTRTPGDLARAQVILDGVLRNNAPQADPYRSLARLLAFRLSEQHRAEEAADRLASQLRDQQRDSQRRLDQLNDKLEALKAIERNLNTRPGQKGMP